MSTTETSVPAIALHAPAGVPCRALVLSGGGLRMSYQAGMLLALQEAGLTFQSFDATAGGCLNLAMLLCGQSAADICRRWRSVKLADLATFHPLKEFLKGGQHEALGAADGLHRHAYSHFGIDVERIRRVVGVPACFNVLDYADKQVEEVAPANLDEDVLRAAMALPGVFAPVQRGGKIYLDATLVQAANLMHAVRLGAEEIWVLWSLGNTGAYHSDPLHLYAQMLETGAATSLNRQLAEIAALNQRIARADSPFGQRRPITVRLLRPDYPLPLEHELYAGLIDHGTLIEMGYADARQTLRQMRSDTPPASAELLVNPSAMRVPSAGIRLRLDYSGELHRLDTGAQHAFTLDVCLHIPDLDEHIAGPEHRARLTGHLQSELWGADPVPLHRGQYVETALEDGARRIGYEMVIEPAGHTITLVVEQTLRRELGVDVWKDLAQLAVRLYDGKAPWATGELRLNIHGINDWLGRIHATEARSTPEAVRTVARYARFFLGEINSVYGWKG